MAPLFDLLAKDKSFSWSKAEDAVFESCKELVSAEALLYPYDAEKPIHIAVDACDVGISGVLTHLDGGLEHPVFFVSRKLTETE